MDRRGTSRFSIEKFLSYGTETFRRGTLVFQKISGIRKFYPKYSSRFSVENFLAQSTEKFPMGSPTVRQKVFAIGKLHEKSCHILLSY